MNEFYVGITIGPIIETLNLATRPASLWCASAMFSWLSEDLCNKAIGMGGSIISPYYPNAKYSEKYSVTAEGVGKYHDRIIFKVCAESAEKLTADMDKIVSDAKQALANELVSDKLAKKAEKPADSLKKIIVNYLQIHYVIEEKTNIDKQNCILRLSPYLDASELCSSFGTDQSVQPIMTLFEGKTYDRHNDLVRLCFGINNGNTSLLDRFGRVRDIANICLYKIASDRKIFNYYAIVQADGDNIGNLLSSLTNDEDVNNFSKKCLSYTNEAAKLISEFGGMTIYAGGDDLLFISPIENQEEKNVFELCNEIAKKFKNAFEEFSNVPTLSFGISVNYLHFPLYEAFSDTLVLLKDIAKKVKTDTEEKNKAAIKIRKNNGQYVRFRYTNNGTIYSDLQKILKPQTDTIVLKSMLYKMDVYRQVIIASLSEKMNLEETFKNLFDSEYHDNVKDYIQTVRKILEDVYQEVSKSTNKDYALPRIHYNESDEKIDEESDEEIALDLVYSMLRVARFFSEKREVEG